MQQPLINITPKQAIWYAVFFVLYEFLVYMANDMIMPGMLNVVDTFHASQSAIASSLASYLLGGASLQLILGPLSDRFGRRIVMLGGAGLFFLTTLMIAGSRSIEQFLLLRFFEGMGLCFICVVGYATIQEIFEETDAVRMIAIMTNVSVIAPLLGPLLGGWFVLYFSWRWVFVWIALFALVALWGLWRKMPEPVGQTTSHGHYIKPMVFSLAVIWRNYRQLFVDVKFMCGSVAGALLGLPCVIWIALAPVIMIAQGHASIMVYGLWQIPMFGAYILGNICLQRMTYRYHLVRITWMGTVFSCVSLLLCWLLPLCFGQDYVWLLPGLLVYFFGYGLACGPLTRYTLYATSVSKGTASALMSMLAMCIQCFGIELANRYYIHLGNYFFGCYCALIGAVYVVLVSAALNDRRAQQKS